MSKNLKITSICMKTVVIIAAVVGIILSAIQSSEAFMGGSRVFMYFTIQSNIFIALVCLVGLILIIVKKTSNLWNIIKFVATISITLTGLVFCFVLAPTMWNSAWSLPNILTHVVVPICAIVDLFLISNLTNYNHFDVLHVIVPPILYVCYAFIGYQLKWQFAPGVNYPYFFLNWGSKAGAFGFSNELPYMGTMWWILFLLVLLIGLGFLYLRIIRFIKSKNIQKSVE